MHKNLFGLEYIEEYEPMHTILLPNQDTGRFCAGFYVPYGSDLSDFLVDSKSLPFGTAHFLEHRMFDMKRGDAAEFFAQEGCFCNAETGTNHTFYYFVSSRKNAFEGMKILFEMFFGFVRKENKIETERNIILSEERMYQDDPYYQIERGIRKKLFGRRSYGYDILGDKKNIQKIHYDHLMLAYEAFYSLKQITFIACGNFSYEKMKDFLMKYPYPLEKEHEIVRKRRLPCYKKSLRIERKKSLPYGIFDWEFLPCFSEWKEFEKEIPVYSRFLLSLFSISAFLEEGKKKHILDDELHAGVEYDTHHFIFSIQGSVLEREPFDFLKDVFLHFEDWVKEKDLDSYRKTTFATGIRILHSPMDTMQKIVSSLEQNLDFYVMMKNIPEISYEKFLRFVKKIIFCKGNVLTIWRKS